MITEDIFKLGATVDNLRPNDEYQNILQLRISMED